MMTIETRIHSAQPAATDRCIERAFRSALDHMESGIERMRIRVEPQGGLFVCRARLWRTVGRTVFVRAKAASEIEAISAAADALARKVRRVRERTRELSLH